MTLNGRAAMLVTLVMLVAAGGCRHAEPLGAGAGAGPTSQPEGQPPIVDQLMPEGWEPGPPRWQPAGRDERLMIRVGGTELAFAERPCAYPGNCGCMVASEHHYTQKDGRWTVVVIMPEVEFRTVVRKGSCGEGCGQQPPPDPRRLRSLGAVSPDAVEIIEQHPRKVVTLTTCTDPMPMP
ncbi:MAG: hypothetical protein H0T76_15030 [Nannocystis sp.]|nr:hypothetical protein [Nannocystis sp.]MBA3547794.1 hypothetical protein [Nannocystis sp.]